jgi:hypothetical protein
LGKIIGEPGAAQALADRASDARSYSTGRWDWWQAGCGTGENALDFASRGLKVTGIDFFEEPINRARQKAAERGLTAKFPVMDAFALKDRSELFDTVIDSGLFHVFNEADRRRFVEGQAAVWKPGGKLFLLCFSTDEPGVQVPRRVSRKEIEVAFAEGLKVESIVPSRYQVQADLKDITFSDGRPKAWFVVVRRWEFSQARRSERDVSVSERSPPQLLRHCRGLGRRRHCVLLTGVRNNERQLLSKFRTTWIRPL